MSERSILLKKKEASEADLLKDEFQEAKKSLEEKIRNLEFEVEERERKIKVMIFVNVLATCCRVHMTS